MSLTIRVENPDTEPAYDDPAVRLAALLAQIPSPASLALFRGRVGAPVALYAPQNLPAPYNLAIYLEATVGNVAWIVDPGDLAALAHIHRLSVLWWGALNGVQEVGHG